MEKENRDLLLLSCIKGTKPIQLLYTVKSRTTEIPKKYSWVEGLANYFKYRNFIKKKKRLSRKLVLTREEPINIDPTKVYYVKTNKEVTIDDLKLEEKDLSISFSSDMMGDNVVFDLEKGEITLKTIPKSLQQQLAKYIKQSS